MYKDCLLDGEYCIFKLIFLGVVNKLLTALNECTEWGQIFILDAVAEYIPIDNREAQSICERVTPRLSHANAAVVLFRVVKMSYPG